MTIRPTTEADWPSLKTLRLATLLDAPAAFGVLAGLPGDDDGAGKGRQVKITKW